MVRKHYKDGVESGGVRLAIDLESGRANAPPEVALRPRREVYRAVSAGDAGAAGDIVISKRIGHLSLTALETIRSATIKVRLRCKNSPRIPSIPGAYSLRHVSL